MYICAKAKRLAPKSSVNGTTMISMIGSNLIWRQACNSLHRTLLRGSGPGIQTP